MSVVAVIAGFMKCDDCGCRHFCNGAESPGFAYVRWRCARTGRVGVQIVKGTNASRVDLQGFELAKHSDLFRELFEHASGARK